MSKGYDQTCARGEQRERNDNEVTFFSQNDPASPSPDDVVSSDLSAQSEATRHRPSRRFIAGWIAIAVACVCALVLAILPAPFVIEQPGPVFNTLGSAQPVTRGSGQGSSSTGSPMITIKGHETSDNAGSLDVLTVSVLGNPEQRPSWFQILAAWFDPSQSVQPIEALFPSGTTLNQSNAENAALMTNSQQDAIAAALNQLGYEFPQAVTVQQVIPDTPAQGVLKVNDEVMSVNGNTVGSIQQLQNAVADNGSSRTAQVGIIRDGHALTVGIRPARVDGQLLFGIGAGMTYQFPFTVTIRLQDVGGPSGGQMFALGIMDKLTPGGLTGGHLVAGTGTIDNRGVIGPIGGIRQKMFGARDEGHAQYFLAPESNCSEVVGHIPSGLHVFAVKTLTDSLTALKAIRTGANTQNLPTCTGK